MRRSLKQPGPKLVLGRREVVSDTHLQWITLAALVIEEEPDTKACAWTASLADSLQRRNAPLHNVIPCATLGEWGPWGH